MSSQQKTAMIFDIVRNSFVDGPGIRTAVFFKGCNLHCAWYHNPESQSPQKELMFFRNRCTGCGMCAKVCPHQLQSCDLCGKCADACPQEARQLCGREMTVEEILQPVCKDMSFYEASGGGVTLSGGECLLYSDFAADLLRACREKGIHTAVDTAGAVDWSKFEQVLPYTDLFLFDVKAFSSEVHLTYVGADNKLILENYKKLIEGGAHVWVRIPIIPGVNDSEAELNGMYNLLANWTPEKIELLPYHAMGEHKYSGLGRGVTKFPVPAKPWMETAQKRFTALVSAR